MPKTVYSSPNSMVWQYFGILHRIIHRLDSTNEREYRQDIALCILVAVTAVETFLNLYFQVLVSKPAHSSCEQYIRNSLAQRRSLDFKMRRWPRRLFGKGIDLSSGVGKRFVDLKDLRNRLMHFSDLRKEVEIAGGKLHNFTEITTYEQLTDADAWNAYHTSLQFVVEVLKLGSNDEAELARLTVQWTTVSLPVILEFSGST